MGKLYFYSDQVEETIGNRRLDNVLFESMDTGSIKIGYLPQKEDIDKMYFNAKVKCYRNYGV